VIDAREHVGTPVITTCPLWVTAAGVRYEVDGEATIFTFGPITFAVDERDSVTDKLYSFAPYVTRVRQPYSPDSGAAES